MMRSTIRPVNIEHSIPSRNGEECGFTLVELMVSVTIFSLIFSMVLSAVFLNQNVYYEDVIRNNIRSNLRTAMDIVSMNARQAGENLSSIFPAVMLENGASNGPDTLTLRRATESTILSLCIAAGSNATQLFVSNTASTEPECTNTTVSNMHAVWESERTNEGGSLRIYIYDYVGEVGEWVDYTGGGSSSGNYYITTSATTAAYPITTTNLYILEEYKFELDSATNTLELFSNGSSTAESVAFEVTGFDVSIDMSDGANQLSLGTSGTYNWQEISDINITLSGQKTRKTRTIAADITGSFFPRNVYSQ